MKADDLNAVLEEPEVHRLILKGYKGPYSLAVIPSPENEHDAAFMLRIGDEAPPAISREVIVHGERVPVIIKRGFLSPKAQ